VNTGLRYRRLWMALGSAMILAVVAGSLLSLPAPVSAPGMDKAQHLFAYGLLMYWWGMVVPDHRPAWAIALTALGLVLEGLQSLTTYRTMEWWDAGSNLAGVLLALALLSTPGSRLLARLDRHLGNRLQARGA